MSGYLLNTTLSISGPHPVDHLVSSEKSDHSGLVGEFDDGVGGMGWGAVIGV